MIGQLTKDEMHALLLSNVVGRIGCNNGTKNYIIPINYVYDGKHIICHSVAGLKIQMMRKNPQVCFEVDEIRSLIDWKSVIVWGQYQEMDDERERYLAMKLFVDRMIRLKISETAVPPETSGERVHPRSPGRIKPVIYRIIISEMTGRFERD
ncbi:MAG TPA: pyridoxamine 5'-phosphate oxidase family protein [Chitinophagaceae bacterium]|nr:pyridoxamine 5'-phosphate oxidase family protein [Chitinophagaceae bacterium]